MRLALRLAIPVAFAALALIACASSSSGPSDAKPATVAIKGFAFSPTTLTVAKGTKVTFANSDTGAHTVTSGANGTKDGTFDQQVAGSASTTIAFDTPGTFDYFCTIHPAMKATITVQ